MVREVKSFLVTLLFNMVYLAPEKGEKTYAQLADPFREAAMRKMILAWTQEMDMNFAKLKNRLCSDQVMVPYKVGRPTRLDYDLSPVKTQAMVSQLYKHPKLGDTWRPVNHTAGAWTQTERGYRNRMYLLGGPFMVFVDHKAMLPLYNGMGRPKQARVDQHRMKLKANRFKMKWEPGKKNLCDYRLMHPPEVREAGRKNDNKI